MADFQIADLPDVTAPPSTYKAIIETGTDGDYQRATLANLLSVTTFSTTGTITAAQLNADDIRLDGNTISTTATDQDLTLAPDGVGAVVTDSLLAAGTGGTGVGQPGTGLSVNANWEGAALPAHNMLFAWNISNGGGESVLSFRTDVGGNPRLSVQGYNGSTATEILQIQTDGSIDMDAAATLKTDTLDSTSAGGIDCLDSASFESFVALKRGSAKTISAGAITADAGQHRVATEASASTDDLDTINAPTAPEGSLLVLWADSDANTVVCKDGTGNLDLAGDFSLTHTRDRILLMYDGVNWVELSRSDNRA